MPGVSTLLQRAQLDGRSAFDRLQKSMEPRLRRFIERLIGRQSVVDEIAQETFLALYVKLERIASEEHLWPFVFRVARHLCYDDLRRQKRFEMIPLSHGSEVTDGEWVPRDTARSPAEAVHWQLAYSRVQRAMDALPEVQRQTLILHFEEDLTYAQTAEAMDVDIGTVKSRIHHARKALRASVGPDFLRASGITSEGEDR